MHLTPEFEADIRSRVNPAYRDQRGTESYERAILLGEIDRLRVLLAKRTEEADMYRAELDAERQRRFDGNRIASEEARDAALEYQGEIMRLREALLRAKQWGGMGKSWHSGVAIDLMAWIDADMKGPLPPMPDYLPANSTYATRDVG